MSENTQKKNGWGRFLDRLFGRSQQAAAEAVSPASAEEASAPVEPTPAPATAPVEKAIQEILASVEFPKPFEVKKMTIADVKQMAAEGKGEELLEYSNKLLDEMRKGEFFVVDGDKQISKFDSWTTTNYFYKTMSIKNSFNVTSGVQVALWESPVSLPEGTLVRRGERDHAVLAVIIASQKLSSGGTTGVCVPYNYNGGVGKNGAFKSNPNRPISFV